jgi:hypothetical protein
MKTTVGTLFIAFVVKVMWLTFLTGLGLVFLKYVLEMFDIELVITLKGIVCTEALLVTGKIIKSEL